MNNQRFPRSLYYEEVEIYRNILEEAVAEFDEIIQRARQPGGGRIPWPLEQAFFDMESAGEAPPEERTMDERSSFGEAVPDEAVALPTVEAPAIVGSPEIFYPHEQLDLTAGREMVNLQANMVIDLAHIHGGMFSPIIVLNNINNHPDVVSGSNPAAEDVPEQNSSPSTPPADPLGDGDAVEQPVARSTRSSSRLTPDSTPQRKKRKRVVTPAKASVLPPPKPEDDDEGLICSICFGEWTMTGDHRVVSLKCGHLFGMCCIKRWLQDNPVASRCCATCKAKAKLADIRFIYGRAVKAIDNTREEQLTKELQIEKEKTNQLYLKLQITNQALSEVHKDLERIKKQLEEAHRMGLDLQRQDLLQPYRYLVTLEQNMPIGQVADCRAMVWANKHKMLLIAQKSTQPLFPGYVIRLLQLLTISGRSTSAVMHVGMKCVRDIALDNKDNLFTCATMENTAKFFSLDTRTFRFSIALDQDSLIWACAFDRVRPHLVYLGTQRGNVYVYDISAQPNRLHVFAVGHAVRDYTAVIKICPVETPARGFLVCKLKSVWFYHYMAVHEIERVDNARTSGFNIQGAFSSMSYNAESEMVLIGIRAAPNVPSVLMLYSLVVNDPSQRPELDSFSLEMLYRFEGSRVQTVMQRSVQILMKKVDTLVMGYLEDSKTLATWCTNSGPEPVQLLPLMETVLDICPISGPSGTTYLAVLTDNRCRIYKVSEAIDR